MEPQFGGNVGSAARALKNLGFSRLVLVRPACDSLGEDARKLAVDAADLLENAQIHDDLDGALDGAGAVVGLTARTGKHRVPHWRLDRIEEVLAGLSPEVETAYVFGREDRGLTDDELDRCTHLVHFPAADAYPSFNLAQSVLLVAYQLRLTVLEPAVSGLAPPAEHGAREAMYAHLERALLSIGFIHDETKDVLMRRLRRMLGRAHATDHEVKLLRGVARQTLWAAERAGLDVPAEDRAGATQQIPRPDGED
ncbi:MAG: TrmJ/YjtD family RNA methyltransferase [bacterium]|nr:TrmJ/YjtD family RNA methyltransferase [bacterium]